MHPSQGPLDKIFSPESVVFLGPSNKMTNMATGQLLTTMSGGFKGEIFIVHPKEERVLGIKTYSQLADLPKPVDLAVMALPTRIVAQTLIECGEKGIKRVIISSAGFREVGREGEKLEKEITKIADRYGIRFIGPNCIGVCNMEEGLCTTWFVPQKSGHVSLVSQSGTYISHTMPYLSRLGFGIAKTISVGNEANIDIVDCLEYLGDDSQTKAIALYIEGIKRGKEFIDIARMVTQKKPVVALYVGGSEAGARSGASHTGALSGPDKIFNGIFKQCGILRAGTLEDLYDWTWALATQPLPKGRRIAILSNSGGPATSMADTCTKRGMEVPEFSTDLQKNIKDFTFPWASSINPIDLTFNLGDVTPFYKNIPEILLNSPEVDGVLVYGVFGAYAFKLLKEMAMGKLDISLTDLEASMTGLCEEFAQIPRFLGKPILGSSFFSREQEPLIALLEDRDIPIYPSPDRASKAMAALCRYAEIKRNEY
ncbi:MAG: CoA-binding protein [Thermodesulfobacteriota bacterium]|nr:CoA-binding protein [Thermodesulfobacteriota bacterium]